MKSYALAYWQRSFRQRDMNSMRSIDHSVSSYQFTLRRGFKYDDMWMCVRWLHAFISLAAFASQNDIQFNSIQYWSALPKRTEPNSNQTERVRFIFRSDSIHSIDSVFALSGTCTQPKGIDILLYTCVYMSYCWFCCCCCCCWLFISVDVDSYYLFIIIYIFLLGSFLTSWLWFVVVLFCSFQINVRLYFHFSCFFYFIRFFFSFCFSLFLFRSVGRFIVCSEASSECCLFCWNEFNSVRWQRGVLILIQTVCVCVCAYIGLDLSNSPNKWSAKAIHAYTRLYVKCPLR